jgi:hypothetical protein
VAQAKYASGLSAITLCAIALLMGTKGRVPLNAIQPFDLEDK